MKKIIRYLGIPIFLSFALSTHAKELNSPFPYFKYTQIKLAEDPRAVFDTLWIDYDITQDAVRGMMIHLKFTVYSLKEIDSDIAIFFEYDDDRGGRLKDKNKQYDSNGGDVAVYRDLKPAYDITDFKDLQLFMPYEELDLKSGKYDLKMVVNLIYKNGDFIQHLDTHKFQFTKP